MRLSFALPGLVVTVAALACSDPNTLPDASLTNAEDTLTIYAVSGTPVYQPSGYSATERRVVRLDQTTTADFAFQITPDGRPILLPGALIGQPGGGGIDPGFQAVDSTFEQLKTARVDGYLTLDTLDAVVGRVSYLRGRIAPSCYLGLPTYGKLEVLVIDAEKRTMRFRVLVNGNCGYKSLEPGLPTR